MEFFLFDEEKTVDDEPVIVRTGDPEREFKVEIGFLELEVVAYSGRPQDRGLRPFQPGGRMTARRSSDHLRHITDSKLTLSRASIYRAATDELIETTPYVVINLDRIDVLYARDVPDDEAAAAAGARRRRWAAVYTVDLLLPTARFAFAVDGGRVEVAPEHRSPEGYVALRGARRRTSCGRHDHLPQHGAAARAEDDPGRPRHAPAERTRDQGARGPRPRRRRPRLHRAHARAFRPCRGLRRRARAGGHARARARRPRPGDGGRPAAARAAAAAVGRQGRARWRASPGSARRATPRAACASGSTPPAASWCSPATPSARCATTSSASRRAPTPGPTRCLRHRAGDRVVARGDAHCRARAAFHAPAAVAPAAGRGTAAGWSDRVPTARRVCDAQAGPAGPDHRASLC